MGPDSNPLMSTYSRLPVAFSRGEGVWLFDDQGNQYLDALGGIGVAALGHAHPQLADALCDQARTLLHTSNLYEVPAQTRLGDKLCQLSGMDKVFFCNSGAEANEAAIKLARATGNALGYKKPAIIVMDGSFHGRTMATLSATGNRKVRAGFEPLVSGFRRVPYNDIDAVRQIARSDSEVVAVLVEPIQGEGGINIPASDYLAALRTVCDENDWLLMLDEIQTGMCRTGRWFAFQHSAISPDVMTLAKALGNGVPIGACLARGSATQALAPGSHGSTFGGNPLACRAAHTVVDIMESGNLAVVSEQCGALLLAKLNQALAGLSAVVEIRGQGMMVAIELDRPAQGLVEIALKQQLLINVTADRVIRLLPPLIINQDQSTLLVERLAASLAIFGIK